jgi:hypothetical protein
MANSNPPKPANKTLTPSEIKKLKNSSLNFVEVAEIRDSAIILREGQMRGVLAVSSANFALKSVQEQEIIVGTFQGILNSLDFPIQILVQSRKLDLNPYIEKLKALEDRQTNDLLRVKMQEYIEYIKEMSREVNIMDKNFYIIIGYDPVKLSDGIFGRFIRSFRPTKFIKQKQEEFLKDRKILMSRVDQVSSKLGGLELKVGLLNTEQLIALMYNSYNPDTSESIRIDSVAHLDLE